MVTSPATGGSHTGRHWGVLKGSPKMKCKFGALKRLPRLKALTPLHSNKLYNEENGERPRGIASYSLALA